MGLPSFEEREGMFKMKKMIDLLIHPYISVGDIRFGMKREDIELLFDKEPDTVLQDYLKRIDLRWENISIKLNRKGLVNEVSLINGKYKAIYKDLDVLTDDNIMKILNKIEKPLNTVGYKVYFEAGIALTGFGRNNEEKTVSVFAKELIKLWKE